MPAVAADDEVQRVEIFSSIENMRIDFGDNDASGNADESTILQPPKTSSTTSRSVRTEDEEDDDDPLSFNYNARKKAAKSTPEPKSTPAGLFDAQPSDVGDLLFGDSSSARKAEEGTKKKAWEDLFGEEESIFASTPRKVKPATDDADSKREQEEREQKEARERHLREQQEQERQKKEAEERERKLAEEREQARINREAEERRRRDAEEAQRKQLEEEEKAREEAKAQEQARVAAAKAEETRRKAAEAEQQRQAVSSLFSADSLFGEDNPSFARTKRVP